MNMNIFVAVIQHIADGDTGEVIAFLPAVKLNIKEPEIVYATGNLGYFTWLGSPVADSDKATVLASINEARTHAYGASLGYADILNKSIMHGLDIGNFMPVNNFIQAM